MGRICCSFLGLALGATPMLAYAQDQSAASERSWRVTVSPYAWGKNLNGKIRLAGLSAPVHVPLSDAYETLESLLMGEITVETPRWGAFVDYQGTDNADTHTVMGLPVHAETELRSVTSGVFYKAYRKSLGGENANGEPRTTEVSPLIGARWSKARADLSVPGLINAGKQAEWTDVIVGVRTSSDISRRWNLSTNFDLGGFDPSERFSFSGDVHLGYRTQLLSRPLLAKVGYAVLLQKYEQTDFTGDRFVWDISSHGPVAGVTMVF